MATDTEVPPILIMDDSCSVAGMHGRKSGTSPDFPVEWQFGSCGPRFKDPVRSKAGRGAVHHLAEHGGQGTHGILGNHQQRHVLEGLFLLAAQIQTPGCNDLAQQGVTMFVGIVHGQRCIEGDDTGMFRTRPRMS